MEFDEFWQEVTKEILSQDRVIHYVKIDDKQFFVNYEQYIVNGFNQIKEIIIVTITEHQLLADTLEELKRYSVQMLSSIGNVSSLFYGDFTEKDLELFSAFTQGLEWIYSSINSCEYLINKHKVMLDIKNGLSEIKVKFEENSGQLEGVLQEEDFIMVGDLIEYEFQPLIKDLIKLLDSVKVS